MSSLVTAIPPARSDVARGHFEALLSLETDCWDVHESMRSGEPDFVLVQSNGSSESFANAHIAGAVHHHHSTIDEQSLGAYPPDTVFVVYCAGPHCNAADRAAAKLAALGRPVKKMVGGITGWLDEGFQLVGDGSSEG
jgi:rhodanese-related sulfurtransferase